MFLTEYFPKSRRNCSIDLLAEFDKGFPFKTPDFFAVGSYGAFEFHPINHFLILQASSLSSLLLQPFASPRHVNKLINKVLT
jgi:hypothetical protein